jgi:hypothetical protein
MKQIRQHYDWHSLVRHGRGGVPMTNEKAVFFPFATLQKSPSTEELNFSLVSNTLKSEQECSAI